MNEGKAEVPVQNVETHPALRLSTRYFTETVQNAGLGFLTAWGLQAGFNLSPQDAMLAAGLSTFTISTGRDILRNLPQSRYERDAFMAGKIAFKALMSSALAWGATAVANVPEVNQVALKAWDGITELWQKATGELGAQSPPPLTSEAVAPPHLDLEGMREIALQASHDEQAKRTLINSLALPGAIVTFAAGYFGLLMMRRGTVVPKGLQK